jgi:antitoxin component of RelBE/YafQ-DinJ toxin-antitoxin module
MNVTLSIDERVLREARKAAESMGLTLNQAVRLYLEELAGRRSAEEDIRELDELSARSDGDSHGWKLNRDEIHERS